MKTVLTSTLAVTLLMASQFVSAVTVKDHRTKVAYTHNTIFHHFYSPNLTINKFYFTEPSDNPLAILF